LALAGGVTAVFGVLVLVRVFAAGTPLAFEAESGKLAAGATTTAVTGASGTGAVKFGAAAGGADPLGLPTDPWWTGGNNYYKAFPAADAYGWSSQSFFPVVAFATNGDHADEVANMSSLGINTILTGAFDHAALKQYHISLLSEDYSPPADSTDTVGYILDDEADGRFEAGYGYMNISSDASGNENFSCVNDFPHLDCSFTETAYLNSLKRSASSRVLPPFTNSLATGGGRLRYNGYTGGAIGGEAKYAPLFNDKLPASLKVNTSTTVSVDPSYVGKNFQNIIGADRYWYAFSDILCTQPYYMGQYSPAINSCPRASAYGRNVDNMRHLDSLDGAFQPVASDVELGCADNGPPCISLGGISGALWSNLIHGAMMAFYFPNFGYQCDGATFAGGNNPVRYCGPTTVMGTLLKNLDAQVKALAPVLNTPTLMYNTYQNADDGNATTIDKSNYTSAGYVESKFNKNLDTMLKWYNGSYYVVAMLNVNAPTGSYALTLPPGLTAGSVQVLYDNDGMPGTASSRTIPVSGGSFTDSFTHEYTSHIYKITP
jgi:hypothetical protein